MKSSGATDTEKSELTAKQREAALCLARGFTGDKTAKEVGVGSTTIDRWKKLPGFQQAIRQAEDALYNEHLRMIKKAAGSAIATLISLQGEKVSHYVRLGAASKLLELGLQIHKVEDLEKEVEELRSLVGNNDDFH